MNKTFQLKHLIFVVFFFQIVACTNENETNNNVQSIDTISAQTIDSSSINQDTLLSLETNEEDDGEPDDMHDYNFKGTYVGTDPNIRLELGGSRFQYYWGAQLKMNGQMVISVYNSDSIIFNLIPFGKNKQSVEILTGWDGSDNAQWVIYEGDTFFRKTFDETYEQ